MLACSGGYYPSVVVLVTECEGHLTGLTMLSRTSISEWGVSATVDDAREFLSPAPCLRWFWLGIGVPPVSHWQHLLTRHKNYYRVWCKMATLLTCLTVGIAPYPLMGLLRVSEGALYVLDLKRVTDVQMSKQKKCTTEVHRSSCETET